MSALRAVHDHTHDSHELFLETVFAIGPDRDRTGPGTTETTYT